MREVTLPADVDDRRKAAMKELLAIMLDYGVDGFELRLVNEPKNVDMRLRVTLIGRKTKAKE